MSLPEYGVHVEFDWSCASETESFCVVPLGEYTVADTTWSELGSAVATAAVHPSAPSAHASINTNRRPGVTLGRRLAGRRCWSVRMLRRDTVS
jgi:hypothetical protein